MTRLGRLPIRHKLVAMIMGTSAVVLLIASAGYLLADYQRAYDNLLEDTRMQAAVLAETAATAIAFRDRESANEIVQSLTDRPHVRAACLYDLEGVRFAESLSKGASSCPAGPSPPGWEFRAGRLHLYADANRRGELHGTLYVRSDVTFLELRLRERALVVAGLLVLALAVALPLSAWLQTVVSQPITRLARTAADISSRGDYSLRAVKTTGDETGMLVDDFNRMVERVELRDTELSKANEDLRREIGERKRAEQERAALLVREREANRLKDEFLATLSHELRTPLNAILGWTTLLRTGAVPPADVGRALDIRALDLAALVTTAVESIRPAAEARGVTIDSDFWPAALHTAGDPDRLQQVAWNLLSNAVKFTPPDGRVTIRLRREAGEDQLTVSDTGLGIAPEFLPHVFDTFRQADASSTRLHGGLGLGLSIVRQLVEMHGGRVQADSEGAHRGATFTIHLPVRRTPHDQSLASATPPLPGCPLMDRTVVVVDDDEDTREPLTSVLRQAGALVVTAASAREGLGACLEHHPDVLVSDIAMPGEDGYTLMERLKAALGGNAPRVSIALTAFAGQNDRRRSTAAGFHAHLAKPFEPADLVGTITNLLET